MLFGRQKDYITDRGRPKPITKPIQGPETGETFWLD